MDKIISHIFGIKKVKMKSYGYDVNESDIYVRPRCLQNVYLGDEVAEEPDFEYVPESSLIGGIGSSLVAGGAHQTSITCSSQSIVGQSGQTAALSQSMMLLEESLTSGAIIGQFEQLYRR